MIEFCQDDHPFGANLFQFAANVHDEVDQDRLVTSLLNIVEQTVQPETVSLWLRSPSKQEKVVTAARAIAFDRQSGLDEPESYLVA